MRHARNYVSMMYFNVKLRRKMDTSALIRLQNYNRNYAGGARQDGLDAMISVWCKFLEFKEMHSVRSQNCRPAAQVCPAQSPPTSQPVSRRILNANCKIQPWGSPRGIHCGIYGEQNGSGTFFSLCVSLFFW